MEGSWLRDFPEECELITKNGIRFVGRWNSENSGKGKIYFTNGDIYKGTWFDFQPHKFGEMKFSNGSVYNGLW